jgi:hypothetical protein
MQAGRVLGEHRGGEMSHSGDVSSVRPRVSIVRQVTGCNCETGPLARRLRRALEPAIIVQCLVPRGFDMPEERRMRG